MRTLRDEAERIGYHCKPGYNTFMDKYGSYRVVEGVLTFSPGRAYPGMVRVGGEPIGKSGEYVKLILPPEEPNGPTKTELGTRLAAVNARADRYEKALREILEYREDDSCEVAAARWRIAREALDE